MEASYSPNARKRCQCSERLPGCSGRSGCRVAPNPYCLPGTSEAVMNRRGRMMRVVLIRMMVAVLVLGAETVAHAAALQPPEGRKIRVAVVLTEGAVVIDFAGPWEVFENVHTGTGDMQQQMPFELYTVGRDRQPIHTSGGAKPGMTVVPDYDFADAPA